MILPRPIEPMLARPSAVLPVGEEWLYEPKLDGFRALVHFDGRRLHIDSRNRKPLDSYFPDLVASLPKALGSPCVLDGELVIGRKDGLDFEELQTRLSRRRDNGRLASLGRGTRSASPQQFRVEVVSKLVVLLVVRPPGGA